MHFRHMLLLGILYSMVCFTSTYCTVCISSESAGIKNIFFINQWARLSWQSSVANVAMYNTLHRKRIQTHLRFTLSLFFYMLINGFFTFYIRQEWISSSVNEYIEECLLRL